MTRRTTVSTSSVPKSSGRGVHLSVGGDAEVNGTRRTTFTIRAQTRPASEARSPEPTHDLY